MDTLIKTLRYPTTLLKSKRCFLDIETTGLSRQNDIIYCIGVIYPEADELKLCQWIIQSATEEKQLLETFIRFLSDFESIATYSGKQFDIPFLLTRLQINDLSTAFIESLPHLDLKKSKCLEWITGNEKLRRPDLEKAIGYQRETHITGKELVKLYHLYQHSQSSSHQLLLLAHNHDELLGCYWLYEIYYLFSGIRYEDITSFEISDSFAHLSLRLPHTPLSHCHLTSGALTIAWTPNGQTLEITITPKEAFLKRYLLPITDYVYIPSQDQIMHKSLAQFIPKQYKQKATKELCFISQSGKFLSVPAPKGIDSSLWYDQTHSAYILYTTDLSLEDIWKYIKKITSRV